MLIYVINLDCQPKRWERIFSTLNSMMGGGKHQVIRLPAIEGKKLSPECIERHQKLNRASDWYPRKLSPNEIACGLSHQKAWQEILSNNQPWACIVEDDAIFSDDFKRFLDDLSWIPQDAQIVKLDYLQAYSKPYIHIDGPSYSVEARVCARICGRHFGTAGYLIRRDCCEALLRKTADFSLPIDNFLFDDRFSLSQEIQTYCVLPALIKQSESGVETTLLQVSRKKASKASSMQPLDKIKNATLRLIFSVYRKAKWTLFRLTHDVKKLPHTFH